MGYAYVKRNGRGFLMAINDNKFRLEDLYIGMEIENKNQLSDIYDTWIMPVKVYQVPRRNK